MSDSGISDIARVPARDLPIPLFLSDIARAYLMPQPGRPPSPALEDKAAWRAYVAAMDQSVIPLLERVSGSISADVVERDAGGARVFDIVPAGVSPDDRGVVLEMHGGALVFCGGVLARGMGMGTAAKVQKRVWAIDYRMPPDHPYPAPLDDCVAAYRALLAERAPGEIVVSGGSAGGNLAAALLLRARDEGLPMPAGLILNTPEIDLTESGDSFHTNDGVDPSLRTLMPINLLYADGHDLSHPYLSPLFGDVTGFPADHSDHRNARSVSVEYRADASQAARRRCRSGIARDRGWPAHRVSRRTGRTGDRPRATPVRRDCAAHRSGGLMPGYDRIVARSFGGAETLELERVEHLPVPDVGEVRLRVEAAGVGYTDTILRRGRYVAYTGGLPLVPGYDVVGTVDAVGPGVTTVRVGDRVADMPVHGAYSQYLLRPARDVVAVPAGVDPAVAIDVPLMWVTAWQMLTRCVVLPRGATILVVGASGAVGRALVMLGRHLGLRVIGTCSTRNIALVEELGASAIDYRRQGLADAIRSASGGEGVAAAFDAVGGVSWEISWAAMGQGGVLIGYGFQDFLESGAGPAEAGKAMHRFAQVWNADGERDGTNRRTRFYDIRERRTEHPDDYRADAEHLLELLATGTVVPPPAEILPLAAAADAHRRIAAGGLTARLVLRP